MPIEQAISRICPTIDDWISEENRRTVEFSSRSTIDRYQPPGKVKCSLHCRNHDSFVFVDAYADTSGDAFSAALAKIEQTIGPDWRKTR